MKLHTSRKAKEDDLRDHDKIARPGVNSSRNNPGHGKTTRDKAIKTEDVSFKQHYRGRHTDPDKYSKGA